MILESGVVVDRYLLQQRLGAGSFGEVWKASQLADGKEVGMPCALKLMKLTQDRAGSSPYTFAAGWLDEVRNLVRVGGDTIPRIFEADVWRGHAYIAMELLSGTTLGARLKTGPIPWRRALFIADQIARALEAAHQIDIVHRDLKPQNIMLVGRTRVCVIDWGIARLKNSSSRTPASDLERRPISGVEATDDLLILPIMAQAPHVIPGTPGYRAPEVYEGAHLAPEQDVYALGVVLYEMIAGCLPHAVDTTQYNRFDPESLTALRESLDTATMDYALVPLSTRCPDAPRSVTDLVDLLLAREPHQRPRRIREAIDHANRFPRGVPARPYVGLSSLGPDHSGLYFGQHDAIQHVLDRLRAQPAALLWGPSGSGKSSLAIAGIAARMDSTLFLDTDGWDIHVIRPREGLRFRVVPHARPWTHGAIGQVVIIDQLEEVVDLEPHACDTFCAAVLALIERSCPVLVCDTVINVTDEVKVIATVRDDLEWRIDREVAALRPLLERRIIVKGVDANLARRIIEEPARAMGYEIEGIEVVSREVEERLSSEPAKLPVVQYALSEWWERRDQAKQILPIEVWRELGGVDGALSSVAERFFMSLELAQQLRLKTLLVKLFQGGRKQPLAESTLSADDSEMLKVLKRLRLVSRREKEGGAPYYEVEHESLSMHWGRLTKWLAEARMDQALAEDLERDAAAYVRDRNPEWLWKKGRIAAAVEMAGRGQIMLSPAAAQFLLRSRRRARHGRILAMVSLVIMLALVAGIAWISNLTADVFHRNSQMQVDLRDDHEKLENSDRERKQMDDKIRGLQDDMQKRLAIADNQLKDANTQHVLCDKQLKQETEALLAAKQELDAAYQNVKDARRDMDISEHKRDLADIAKMKAEEESSQAKDKAFNAEDRLQQVSTELRSCRQRQSGR